MSVCAVSALRQTVVRVARQRWRRSTVRVGVTTHSRALHSDAPVGVVTTCANGCGPTRSAT